MEKYTIGCKLNTFGAFIPTSVFVELSTDTIGRVFAYQIKDKLIAEIRYFVKEASLLVLVSKYLSMNIEQVFLCIDLTICYSNSKDVPLGKNVELDKIDRDILASDVAVLLLEECKKSKILTL